MIFKLGEDFLSNTLYNKEDKINDIFDNIKELIINSRDNIYNTINTGMINLYWNIGKVIIEIQHGDERATYKLHLPTEQELIDAVEEEKKNLELNK